MNGVLIVLISICMYSGLRFSVAQEIFFGKHFFIEYQRGNLPIVITVSHGGNLNPSSIPDRTCYSPVLVSDLYVNELAQQISFSLYRITGCNPHMILCHLKRTKLDCNRPLEEGACDDPLAVSAWNEFHEFIKTAQHLAGLENGDNTFFIDLHGHGKPYQRIELGYALYGHELELSDSVLNTTMYIERSSINELSNHNILHLDHAELLRGEFSLGTLLTDAGYPSLPSQQIPSPGDTTTYYRGGYITRTHTCANPGNNVNGVQMEINFTGIRDLPENLTRFADTLAEVMADYLKIHRNYMMTGCGATFETSMENLEVYPNPCSRSQSYVQMSGLPPGQYRYQILSLTGQLISAGRVEFNKIPVPGHLSENICFLVIEDERKQMLYTNKLLFTF